jgi:hypothetical protein
VYIIGPSIAQLLPTLAAPAAPVPGAAAWVAAAAVAEPVRAFFPGGSSGSAGVAALCDPPTPLFPLPPFLSAADLRPLVAAALLIDRGGRARPAAAAVARATPAVAAGRVALPVWLLCCCCCWGRDSSACTWATEAQSYAWAMRNEFMSRPVNSHLSEQHASRPPPSCPRASVTTQ